LLVDRNSFRSPCRACNPQERSTLSIRFNLARRPKFISVTSFLTLTHRGRSPPGRQSVDRNSFRSPCRARDSGSVQPCPIGSTLLVDRNSFRSPCRARNPQERSTLSNWFNLARRPEFISVTSFPALTHRGRSPPGRQSVDRNSFRSPCRARDSESVQPCPIGSTLLVDRNSFRSLLSPHSLIAGEARLVGKA